MPNPLNVPITPPRVAFIDPRTGNVSREWYMFFLSLYQTSGGSTVSLDDLQKGPPALTVDEINNAIDKATTNLAPSEQSAIEQIAELRKQIDAIETQVRPELGTMSQLQQANVPWQTFDTTAEGVPPDIGTVAWDGGTTLGIQMTANVLQRVGESEYVYVKASSAITKGQLCYHTGSVGASGVITAAPTPLNLADPNQIIGVAAESIALNGFGLIQISGDLRGFNTTGSSVGETWADGDPLYYNPAYVGSMTKVKPSAPNQKSYIGEVINAGSAGSGSMHIRIVPGSVLGGTDSNVQFGTLANGDLIQYDSALGYWKNVPATTVGVTSFSAGTTGFTPSTASSGAVTLAGTLSVANGGTGVTTAPTNGQLLIGNGTGYTVANLTAGTNISISNTAGGITINSSNPGGTVTSVNASGGTTGMTFTGGPITSSGTLTLGGTLAIANGGTGLTALGTGVQTWLGTPSSANLAAAVTDETGSGSLVFATSPTLVTPTAEAVSGNAQLRLRRTTTSAGEAWLGANSSDFVVLDSAFNTRFSVNLSTGQVSAAGYSGSGANLTSIPNSALVNSSITINGSAISLGGSVSVGTVTSVAALTLGTSGTDLSSTVANGTTTPVITLNVPTASATNRGALSSTDWSTFNNKQAALVSGTNIKTVNGTSLLGSGDLGTIGVAYGGTGLTSLTASYIPYGNGTGAYSSSNLLQFDGTRLRIGGNAGDSAGLDVIRAGATNYIAKFRTTSASTPYGVALEEPSGAAAGYPTLIVYSFGGATTWFRIDTGGNTYFSNVTTTATAANAVLDTGAGYQLKRSTSSARFKRDVEDIDPNASANVFKLRPIWYRSKANDDNQKWSWYGLLAEEVAEVEPRLVQWGYMPEDYDTVVDVHKTLEPNEFGEMVEREVKHPRKVVKPGATMKPDGVMYDRLSVMLLAELKKLRQEFDDYRSTHP